MLKHSLDISKNFLYMVLPLCSDLLTSWFSASKEYKRPSTDRGLKLLVHLTHRWARGAHWAESHQKFSDLTNKEKMELSYKNLMWPYDREYFRLN